MLGPDDRCVLYEQRPVTCRLYGVPTAIHGKAHVCGKCGFARGGAYPTVAVGSRYRELHTVYVPVSMALLTKYDDAYLGVGPAPQEQE